MSLSSNQVRSEERAIGGGGNLRLCVLDMHWRESALSSQSMCSKLMASPQERRPLALPTTAEHLLSPYQVCFNTISSGRRFVDQIYIRPGRERPSYVQDMRMSGIRGARGKSHCVAVHDKANSI